MLKILQARLQQYVNRKCPDVQADFRKGRGTRDQITDICWIIEKAREFQKNTWTMPKPLTVWITINCGKFWKRWEYQTTWPVSWETYMQVRKQQLCIIYILKVGGEGEDRGWDGWMASLTQWTRVWVNSGSWRWTGRPGVLQSRGLQRVRHDWATELNGWLRTTMALLSDCDWGLKSLKYLHSSEQNFASPWNRATKTYEIILSSMTSYDWGLRRKGERMRRE